MGRQSNLRADRVGKNRTAFEKNKKRILATQDICGICGKIVDKTLKRPDPMAPEIDHIIPVAKGGHPSDIGNLQLVHAACNKVKSDKVMKERKDYEAEPLAWSFDWLNYRAQRENNGG